MPLSIGIMISLKGQLIGEPPSGPIFLAHDLASFLGGT